MGLAQSGGRSPQLTESYPTRPAASTQTLIHGGRVAKDEKKLDEVISKVRLQGICSARANALAQNRRVLQHHDDGPKMFHLIIKQMQHDAAKKRTPTAPNASVRTDGSAGSSGQQTVPTTPSQPAPAPAPPRDARG